MRDKKDYENGSDDWFSTEFSNEFTDEKGVEKKIMKLLLKNYEYLLYIGCNTRLFIYK